MTGPPLGLAAHWVKTRHDRPVAIGIGAMSGTLVGEGVYGLAYVADTTHPAYWRGEILVGVVLLVWVASRRLRGPQTAAVAVVIGALTAVVFVAVYSQDLIAVLP